MANDNEVIVTMEMEEAGIECLADMHGESDLGYLVRSIYRAMEHERRDSNSFVERLSKQSSQIDQ